MRFVTLFPETENIHLTKDVGMIAYTMYRDFGYKSRVVCYKNGEYPYLDKEVKGLELDFIKRYTGNPTLDSLVYLVKNSKKIDVLHVFHLNKRSIGWAAVYKLINRKGKVYLKLDTADHAIEKQEFQPKTVKNRLRIFLVKRCDIISIEVKNIYNCIRDKWPTRIEYIPNGFYSAKRKIIQYEQKENILCTVGRIGTKQKATEVLLEGFKRAAGFIDGWQLRIIGPIEKDFEKYIHEFLRRNPELKERIKFIGPIVDKDELEKEYNQAKIFCLTSRWEGYPIVPLEAMKAGCFIISTDLDAAWEMTDNKKYGDIFEIDNYEELAALLKRYCHDEPLLRKVCGEVQEYAYNTYSWTTIGKKIHDFLKESCLVTGSLR